MHFRSGRGGYPTYPSLSVYRCERLSVRGPFRGVQAAYLCSFYLGLRFIPGLETPSAIGYYIAISKRYRDRGRSYIVLTSRPNNYHFDPCARPTYTQNLSSCAPFICRFAATFGDSRRMHACGALALRFPGSWNLLAMAALAQ
eukprot:551394-Pleurochrysis_carterae.AAC.1